MTSSRRLPSSPTMLLILRVPRAVFAVLLGTILVGCSHKNPTDNTASVPATASADASQPAASGQPVYAPPATPITVAAAPDGGVDLRGLNRTYIRWVVQTHQRPKTFEEFEAASGIVIPPAPAGKKYVIDHAGLIAVQNQ